jgi:hypothetical protein
MNTKIMLLLGLLGVACAVAVPADAAPRSASKSSSKSDSKAVSKSAAKTDPKAPVRLDQEAVKSYYNDGDFGPAIALLEDFQKASTQYTRDESLMVYKYLGVMYTADQSTREKGKSYFYKLLKSDPEAKILDMYVSIVVQDIFKNTLDELMGQKPQSATASGSQKEPLYFPRGDADEGKSGGRSTALKAEKSHTLIWLIGGLGLAAGIAGGYYVYSQSSEKPDDTFINVPE